REVANFSAHLEHFFDPSIMRDYRPDYVSYQEYGRRIQASKMRSSLVQAAQLSWSTPMKDPRLKFVKRSEAIFANELSESQKMAAQLEPQIDGIYQILQIGFSDRKTENSLRWQAAYDLALGRVLATKVRTETYNAMLAAAKRGLKPSVDKNNTWTLVPANEISVGSQYSKAAEKATELLKRVASEHPGTPWALLAERELANPIGWRWQDSFTDLTPPRPGNGGNGNNNAAAVNDAARMIKKPPPKRRPPKL
ncbi:MAG: VWA domain-containing protein, partial [Planctomycetaceae bacterium]|nr:VWA domain-containing protein [Planctomycetaceae bacterium]